MKLFRYLKEKVIVPSRIPQIRQRFKEAKPRILAQNPPTPKSLKKTLKILNSLFKDIHFINSEDVSFEIEGEDVIEGMHASINLKSMDIRVELGKSTIGLLTYPEDYDRIIEFIIGMIAHELIHMEQIMRIAKKGPVKLSMLPIQTDQDLIKYISHPHEIGAYAYQVAKEILDAGYDTQGAKNLIKYDPKKVEDINNVYGLYLEFFKGTKIMNKLNKLIFSYLENPT